MTLALIYDDAYLTYEITPIHPERSERLACTLTRLEEEGLLEHPAIDIRSPSPVELEHLLRVHEQSYLSRLRQQSRRGNGGLSGDTRINRETWQVIRLAAGGLCLAGDMVATGEYDVAYAMTRPPGHHASQGTGHGFCYINNTAVLVRYLQEVHGYDRVAIWDIDAHHGDGTQNIFYEDPSTLVISTHQDPETQFPHTGTIDETGAGAGTGAQINVPLPAGAGDPAYDRIIDELFIPATNAFDPECLIIEAGHDAHFADFTSELQLTSKGYRTMIQRACETAAAVCDGRIIAGQSGGYSTEKGLPFTTLALLTELAGLETDMLSETAPPDSATTSTDINSIINEVQSVHDVYL
jgi:acetoin utilization deacetylase AcuC-like enzyme